MISLKTGITKSFRDQIHAKILDLPLSFFTEKRKGDILSRITNDVGEVEGSILGSLIELIRSPLMITIYLSALFIANPQLTLFAILVFPVTGIFISILGKNLKRNSQKTQDQLGKIISYVDEVLGGIKVIKIFNADKAIQQRFEEATKRHRTLLSKVLKRKELASPVSEFLGSITMVLIVFYGGKLQLENQGMKGSEFVAYIALFYTLLEPIKNFSKAFSNLSKGEASAERIFEIIDLPLDIEDKPDAMSVTSFKQALVLDQVSFKYDEKEIIRSFNLELTKGKTVALVGSSGSGKSTLANLIARFYDVTSGSIRLDGRDIRDIKIHDYRQLFGMVTQESILFNDTVYNNLSLGLENVSMADIHRAAQITNAHTFIEQLEEGYQTIIGEGGNKLSGGQKQRLSIARAVLHDNPIMILDEATSALDSHSEKLVQEALDNMMKDRTSLVIAHRLSTIQNADWIVVLEQGSIVEQGTHQELMAKSGAYKRLVELQSFS